RGPITWIVKESLEYRPGHGIVHVVADEVHQLEWAHPEATELAHRPIDCRRVGDALLEHSDRFTIERPRDAIHDEAGGIGRHDGSFLPRLDESRRTRHDVSRGVEPRDDLDERQHRRWIEEMHADDALGCATRRCYRGHGQ